MFNLRLTGYGSSNQWQNLVLNGDKRKHKLWETKIIGYLKLKWIKEVFGVGEVNTDKWFSISRINSKFEQKISFISDVGCKGKCKRS